MDEAKVEEALTKWLDDDSEHDAADFGARFNSDHPGYDMTEMAMGFYAGYVAALAEAKADVPMPEASGYRAPDDCYDLVKKICHSVSEAMHTPIVLDVYGEAADMLNQWARDRALGYIAWASSHPAPPASVQPVPSEEDAITILERYIENGSPLPPKDDLYWKSCDAIAALRAQLAEPAKMREALTKIYHLEQQVPYASAHGFVEYSLKKIGNIARAALDGKEK